jgi:hypothetical protein
LSSRAPQRLVRRALAVVLLTSGLKLVGAGTEVLGLTLLAVAVLGPLAWMAARRIAGLPPSRRAERRAAESRPGTSGPGRGPTSGTVPAQPSTWSAR